MKINNKQKIMKNSTLHGASPFLPEHKESPVCQDKIYPPSKSSWEK